jgi:predicted esterase
VQIELPAAPDTPRFGYSLTLPPEYAPHRSYPLIVALRSQGMTAADVIRWWAGTPEQPGAAMRRGYIVIAPDYADPRAQTYDDWRRAHQSVLDALNDVRQRYSVDSDRIFLTGHGLGGDAAFDIGMSHPELFAGVIPIVGLCERYCRTYWKNCEELALYVVAGQKDRNTLEVNAITLNRMMIGGQNLIYTEYIERGYETYYEEQPRIFEWMALHRRPAERQRFECQILRGSDASASWVTASAFPESAFPTIVWEGDRTPLRPQLFSGNVSVGNTIRIRSGGRKVTLRLSPRLLNLDERVHVYLGSRRVFNDYVRPDLAALLDELRTTGDRQRLTWARLEL